MDHLRLRQSRRLCDPVCPGNRWRIADRIDVARLMDFACHWRGWVVALGVVPILAACVGHRFYSAAPIEARVVDGGTPVEGVVVVANWRLMGGGFGGRVHAGNLMTMETVTDADGRFRFPGWGPLRNPGDGYLDDEDPQLYFFKPGYQLIRLLNDPPSDKRSLGTSQWSGRTVQLPRFPGSVEKYAEHLARVGRTATENLAWKNDCNLTRTPLLLAALDRENRRLAASGLNYSGFTLDSLLPEYVARCGFPLGASPR